MLKLVKKVRDVLINVVKISYLYIKLYNRKFQRLIQRFFSRVSKIWYIGFLLLVVYTLITFLLVKVDLIDNYMTFVPGVISTVFTIYLIDFLRIEYERRRDANRRYLFNLELFIFSNTIERTFTDIFGLGTYKKLSEEKIKEFLKNKDFWEEEIDYRLPMTDERRLIRRDHYFLITLNELEKKCLSFIASYLYLAEYEEYRLLHRLKSDVSSFSTPYSEDTNLNKVYEYVMINYLKQLISYCEEIDEIYHYWFRDDDLTGEIRERKIRIKKIINAEYEQKSLAS